MSQINSDQEAELPESKKYFLLILLLFFGSGCAALIYEIVWLQLLSFVIGSSSISLCVLLGTYMGGMCLGSFVLPRIVSAKLHPLRVYAFLELGIGIIGVIILYALPYINKFYIGYVGSGMTGIMMRGVVCAICLLPPTLLMGATLPAIARWIETTPSGVSWLGFFYGGNIMGAVFGCLLAGFYLLRIYDMATATYIAAAVNLTVAAAGVALSFYTHYTRQEKVSPENTIQATTGNWTVYLAIALSGLSALGAEVVWTRLLSLILGGTVYTFSIILAVFLLGLGIGSSVGSFISRYASNPRMALGLCQLLLAAAVAWTAYLISSSLPFLPIDPSLAKSPWLNFQLDLLRCLWAILPAACLWGASFPLALACVVLPGQEPGKVVGGVYAVNTAGAILGSLGFSMIIIPLFGTQQAERLLIALAVISSLVVLLPVFWPTRTKNIPSFKVNSPFGRFAGISLLAIAVLLTSMMVGGVNKIPWGMIAYGRFMATLDNRLVSGIVESNKVPTSESSDIYCIYAAEGMDVSVAVTQQTSGVKHFHGAGKVQASTEPQDMRLQRMLGHLSALLNKKPESVLVVACGAGVTAGSFLVHPDVKKIVIVDIEPLVPKEVTPQFSSVNYGITDGVKDHNPRIVNGKEVQVIYDDGRHYINTLPKEAKFDIITSDPIDPWVKGTAALNSYEYYQMCKEHLNPGGIMSLWMPFYEGNSDTVKSLISTFFKVFPNGMIFSNDANGEGYDAVLLAQNGTTQINLDELRQRLRRPDHAQAAQSLAEVNFNSVEDLLATYAGRAANMQPWMKDAQLNYDRNLRLQYLAGMWLNSYMESMIFSEILEYYKFPNDIFIGSDKTIRNLQAALIKSGRKEVSD